MGNHTVKKNTPAGKDDKTIIVGMQINQKVREIGKDAQNKTKQVFELEAKGKLSREVVPKEYMVIKAYSNDVKAKATNADKKQKEDDPIK